MSKIIIYFTGHPRVNGYSRGEFQWSEAHQCYLFQNKVFDETNFNDAFTLCFTRYHSLFPLVKFVEENPPAQITPPLTADELPIAEDTTDEILVARAEDTLERLAPHRLKKKPGPKSALVPA
jgi:hypothetical protein